MKFFTPELFERFNSADDRIADAASDEWEKSLEDYRRHLDQIRPPLPAATKRIEQLGLHDAELRGEPEFRFAKPERSSVPGIGTLALQQGPRLVFLIYVMDRQIDEATTANWIFSKDRVHWLYDEFDLGQRPDEYVHRILLSDGRIWAIPFFDVDVQIVNISSSPQSIQYSD